jgi:hypothetical protein
MSSSPFNSALLRGLLAGAVVLTGTACSRPDRAESGSDNTAVMTQDTASPSTQRGDTTMTADSAAGYRAMDRDTAAVSNESDSARVAHDSSETSQAPSDTAAVESSSASVGAAAAVGATAAGVEMARDTSTIAEQTDTVAISDTAATLQASVDTSNYAEPSDSGRAGAVVAAGAAGAAVAAAASRDNDAAATDGPVRPPEEASETRGQVTTDDHRSVASADTLESEHVRPPEDSTEIRGQVATDSTEIPAYETADEQIINPTDEVGAAAIASDVTGAEAVALMSREGVRCAIVDPEENEAVRWDMSSTPVTLNPCGMGSMVISKIWTSVE